MRSLRLAVLAALVCATSMLPAGAARAEVPGWARAAVDYLAGNDYIQRRSFHPRWSMSKRAFGRLMTRTFGGGYDRTEGSVTAAEVDAALVEALGKRPLARSLRRAGSPDGWTPSPGRRFGTEIVARELGLRFDHPVGEEADEASAGEPLSQADIAYAVWKAKTGPSTWSADALEDFSLPVLGQTKRAIVRYAFSLVGKPYVWGGEWHRGAPAGYPYGAQPHGGFDCSGFSWFVLRSAATGWKPPGRPYQGWSLPQRSSSDMAAAAPRRLRFEALEPADLVLFAPNGRRSGASSVYHVGVYLGRGWMVHSSGSRAGVSLADISEGWWRDEFAWGRRVVS